MGRIKHQYDENLAARIKEARIKKGYSRQKLSNILTELSNSNIEYKHISASISAVKSWEGIGRKYSPDNTTLKAIGEVLHCDLIGNNPKCETYKELSDYTTDELIAELKRRIEE